MKLRNGKSIVRQADLLSQLMTNWLKAADPSAIWANCSSCAFLSADDRTCTKHNAQPPVSIVVQGCNQYRDSDDASLDKSYDDEIPF